MVLLRRHAYYNKKIKKQTKIYFKNLYRKLLTKVAFFTFIGVHFAQVYTVDVLYSTVQIAFFYVFSGKELVQGVFLAKMFSLNFVCCTNYCRTEL